MSYFKPIKQSRLSEEVLSQLKEAILLGKFKSGQKIPSERELTEAFQVSRGVVREAIRALEITGFVVLRQGPAGGAFVTYLSTMKRDVRAEIALRRVILVKDSICCKCRFRVIKS